MTFSSVDISRWSTLALALALSVPGCGGDSGKPTTTKGKASAGKPAKAAGGKAEGGKADGGKADAGKAADGSADGAADDGKVADDGKAADGAGTDSGNADGATPAADDGKAATGGPPDAADAESGAPADGGKADGADDGAAGETGAPAVDTKALLKEVAKKRTKDERANAALAEAEAAGAEAKDLARAAHKRGKALHATPDRAKVFYEYALAKDPKYPDPAFELAKQAVNTGELETAIKHLTEVKKRKGKKLLSQIDFDPMWDVLKDDPDVRQLVEG